MNSSLRTPTILKTTTQRKCGVPKSGRTVNVTGHPTIKRTGSAGTKIRLANRSRSYAKTHQWSHRRVWAMHDREQSHLFVAIDEVARPSFSPEPLLVGIHFQYRILGRPQLHDEGICELLSNTRVFRIFCLVDTFSKILLQIKEPRIV